MTSSTPRRGEERSLRVDALRNRLRILTTADAVFTSKGLDVSTYEIARLAGVSIGTLYRHFATKEALLDAVLTEHLHRLADRADHLARAPDPGRAFFDFFTGTVSRAGLDAQAVATRPHASLHAALDRLAKRAQRAGHLRPDVDADDLVFLMALANQAMRHGGPKSRTLAVVKDGLRRLR